MTSSTSHQLKIEQLLNELDFLLRLFSSASEKSELLSLVTVAQSSAKLASKARRELMASSTDHAQVREVNVDRMLTLRGLPPSIGWGEIKRWLKEKHIECNRVDKGPGWGIAILTLAFNSRDVALKALSGATIEGSVVSITAGEPSAEELAEQKELQEAFQASEDTSSYHKSAGAQKRVKDNKKEEKGQKRQRK